MSQGLKEQMATIFRISVAQHLASMIVLIDHLTNADPERMSWFGRCYVGVGRRFRS